MVRESLAEKVTFEERPEGSEGTRHRNLTGRERESQVAGKQMQTLCCGSHLGCCKAGAVQKAMGKGKGEV